jgi:two-component system, NarL family, sensor kinase
MLAAVSDLTPSENEFERSEGRLLEVYRQIETPSGEDLVLETYFRYDEVISRQWEIWWTFAPISVAVLVVLLAVQLPLAARMVRAVRQGDVERILLHARAADATAHERRRIAGNLHDGVVQDLAAAALVTASVRDRLAARSADDPEGREIAGDLSGATSIVRQSVSSMRSLLIEIYPPHLARAGLLSALTDLLAPVQARGVQARLEAPDDLDVPIETAGLLFRVAQEALVNVSRHARARSVVLSLVEEPGAVTMEVHDDGVGFDPGRKAEAGHFGLQVLADLAADGGGTLDLATAPGLGTSLRLRLPLEPGDAPG